MQLQNNPADIPCSYNIKAKRKYFEVKFHVKCILFVFTLYHITHFFNCLLKIADIVA